MYKFAGGGKEKEPLFKIEFKGGTGKEPIFQ